MTQIVVIGAGQAGAALVAKLRELGHDGRITLIGEETAPPYQRPPLSKKYLRGEFDVDRLFLKPRSYYAEADIRLMTGTRATAIDREGRAVLLEGAEPLPYDRLVLATGGRARRLPQAIGGGLDGVFTMRTMADADRLGPELREGRRLLVVGGGYIGLEAAAVAAERGLSVTVIEMAERILQRVAAPETSALIRSLHQSKGVEVVEGAALAGLDAAAGRVTAARLACGRTIACDLVVAGIGLVPETTLAEAAGLAIENGIATDAMGRTSDPAIFAAGDCASMPWGDARVRIESVQNAIDQAEHVAAALLGAEKPYAPVPWFWSDQYEARLQIAGLNLGYDRTIERPGHREGGASVWYFAGERFLAVDALNDPKAYMQGKRWLEAGAAPDPAIVADPARVLRDAA